MVFILYTLTTSITICAEGVQLFNGTSNNLLAVSNNLLAVSNSRASAHVRLPLQFCKHAAFPICECVNHFNIHKYYSVSPFSMFRLNK